MIFSYLLGEKVKDNVDFDKGKTTKEEAKDTIFLFRVSFHIRCLC